ncbi:TerC family protein [Leptospira gomenensis]|uniref:TerC family protein n=1 Tax=Leptospira gomenensis TaxID=2484974 RepID=A0A5F1YRG6_9LEPT|nr:TerC family protein [Leptospira gomenensis]TGK33841.1 TerC family protein [Leptospira gomenensis]TGK36295.1 TerC family protein [Leptospira gomenensis]TGK52066.1 TerC family protein [Leptospira gomenensis]TGK59885.1 TerC family protein [Leptospira gomenensis]
MGHWSSGEWTLVAIFTVVLGLLVYLDLFVLNKRAHKIPLRESVYWSLFWFSLAISFSVLVYFMEQSPADPLRGRNKALEFVTGYLLEYSLSVDNLFVFIMVFQKFRITPQYQPLILKWGIIGALLFRAIMIFIGAGLISQFGWILYLFGFFLLYTAVKMFVHKEEEEDFHPETSPVIKFAKKFLPMTHAHHPEKFVVKEHGNYLFTSTFITLLIVEFSDIMFALDSIPAIFSITTDPLIVYTSNIFAILGLRSLYFMLSGVMELFVFLKRGVSLLLAFVGIKLLLPLFSPYVFGHEVHIPILISLAVIVGTLTLSILASVPHYLKTKKEN